jgi:hypothetical protein
VRGQAKLPATGGCGPIAAMICPSTRSASTARTEEVMRPWRTRVHQHRPRPRRGVTTTHRPTGIRDWIIQGVKGEFYPCKPDDAAVWHVHERNRQGHRNRVHRGLHDAPSGAHRIDKAGSSSAENQTGAVGCSCAFWGEAGDMAGTPRRSLLPSPACPKTAQMSRSPATSSVMLSPASPSPSKTTAAATVWSTRSLPILTGEQPSWKSSATTTAPTALC